MYYKLFINWTNQKIKQTFVTRNMFDLRHVRPFEKSYVFCLAFCFRDSYMCRCLQRRR